MPQQTIYLDTATEKRAKDAARAAGVSVSRWIAEVIRQRTQAEWPPEIAKLAGAWSDIPTARALRESKHRDSRRETL